MTHYPREPAPSGRSYSPGNYAHSTYRSQSGVEIRLLYGNKRLATTVQLVYNNIPDADAEMFLDHYDSVKGTFESFDVGGDTLNAGWTGTQGALNIIVGVEGTQWRYAGPPQLQSVYIGRSNLVVDLIGVTV